MGRQPRLCLRQDSRQALTFTKWATSSRSDGYGCSDDTNFINAMAPLVKSAAFAGYWAFDASDDRGDLTDGSKPKAAAAFEAAIGRLKAQGLAGFSDTSP